MASLIGKGLGTAAEMVVYKPKMGMDEAMRRYAEYMAKKDVEAAAKEAAEITAGDIALKKAIGQSVESTSRLAPIGSGSAEWVTKTIARDVALIGDQAVDKSVSVGMRSGAKTLSMSDAYVQKGLKEGISKQMKRSSKHMGLKLKKFAKNNPKSAAFIKYGAGLTAIGGVAYTIWDYFDDSDTDSHKNGDLIDWLTENGEKAAARRAGASLAMDHNPDELSTDEKELIVLISLLPNHIRNWLTANMDNDYLLYAKPDSDINIFATYKDCDFQDVAEAVRDLSFMLGTEIKDFVDKGDFIASREGMYIVGPSAESAKFHYAIQSTVIPFLTHTYLVTGGQTGEHLDMIRDNAVNLYTSLMTEFRLTGNVECELLARTVYNYL